MWKLTFGAFALVCVAPAMAADLGCWDTSSVTANPGSPSGTYVNSAASVDYIEPTHEGVDLLLADLPGFGSGSFVICLQGNPTTVEADVVWQLNAAIICSIGSYSGGECPG